MNIYFGNTIPYPTGGIFINSLEPFPLDYDQTSRDWYKSAVGNNKNIYITDPYVDFVTKKYVSLLLRLCIQIIIN